MRQVRRLVEVVAQEVEGRRRIPLRGAYKASQHTAVAADDEGGRQALESKAAPQLALGVQVDRQVLEIEAREERIDHRSEEHTSELQSLIRTSYAVFCLQKKKKNRPKLENRRTKAQKKTGKKVSRTCKQ